MIVAFLNNNYLDYLFTVTFEDLKAGATIATTSNKTPPITENESLLEVSVVDVAANTET